MDSNSPIPAFVLIHNIQVEETHNKNSPATGIYDNSQTIQHEINRVRIQPVNKRELSSEAPAIQGTNYMLFIDRVNSINKDGYLPKIDDTIICNKEKHLVTQVAAIYALEKQPHHWEVLLT